MANVSITVNRASAVISPRKINITVRPALTISSGGSGGGGTSSPTNLSYNPATRVLSSSTGDDVTLPLVDGTSAGLMAAADKTKLDGVAAGATANASDAALRDRSTHTGEQAIETVTGLSDALAAKESLANKDQPGGYIGLLPNGQIDPFVRIKIPFTRFYEGNPVDFPPAVFVLPDETPVFFFGDTENTYATYYEDDGSGDPYYETAHVEPNGAALLAAIAAKQDALGFTPEDAAQKGIAGGYASLDGTGKVPAAQLPSYVDDVIEVANFAALPGTGETGKLYITADNNKQFRWSGSAYVEINPSPGSTDGVTEGSTNLYFTETRVRNTTLSGYAAAGSRVALAAGDSILGAFNKIGKWLGDLGDAAFAAASAAGLAMLTAANAAAQTALLDVFTSGAKGLAPASGGGTTNFLRADGTWAEPSGSGDGGPVEEGPTQYRYFTDFMSVSAGDMSNQSAGTGASAAVAAWPFGGNPPASGFVNGALGTTATGRAAWMSVSAIALHPRVGEILFKTRMTLRTLSDAVTANYFIEVGMMDTPSGVIANGMYFRYNHGVNGGRWLAVCEVGSVETTVDTGVTATIAEMETFEIRGNAAGTEYTFYINNVLVATINSGLPAVTTGLGWGIRAIRTVGTAATSAWMADYLLLEQAMPSRT